MRCGAGKRMRRAEMSIFKNFGATEVFYHPLGTNLLATKPNIWAYLFVRRVAIDSYVTASTCGYCHPLTRCSSSTSINYQYSTGPSRFPFPPPRPSVLELPQRYFDAPHHPHLPYHLVSTFREICQPRLCSCPSDS